MGRNDRKMMCNGDFLLKDFDEAIDYLNDLAEKAHTWTGPSIADSTNKSKTGGIYYLREEDNLKSQVEVLSRKLQALETKDSKIPETVARVESQDNCFICGGVDHLAQVCPTLSEMKGVYEEQCNSLGTYRKPFSPYSDTYNPGWRNHPNFSWKNDANNNHWKPEAPPSQQSYPPSHYNALPPRFSMEGTLQKFETILTQVVEDQKEMKSQITMLTSALSVQERGKIPSQPHLNPKGQHIAETSTSAENVKGVNAVTTRSGKVLDEPTLPSPPVNKSSTNPKDALLE
ncbi:hypothetical protein ACOSQ3_019444 [Xanthoceras sorbifolium]